MTATFAFAGWLLVAGLISALATLHAMSRRMAGPALVGWALMLVFGLAALVWGFVAAFERLVVGL